MIKHRTKLKKKKVVKKTEKNTMVSNVLILHLSFRCYCRFVHISSSRKQLYLSWVQFFLWILTCDVLSTIKLQFWLFYIVVLQLSAKMSTFYSRFYVAEQQQQQQHLNVVELEFIFI